MKFKSLFLILVLFMVLLCCFSAVSASDNVNDEVVAVSNDVSMNEVVSEVDSDSELISTLNDEDGGFVDDSGNESLAVQDETQARHVNNKDSTLTAKNEKDTEVTGQAQKGDGSGENSILKNDPPVVDVIVVDRGNWIGNNVTINVNVANSSGIVNITIEGESKTVDLVDGVATAEFAVDNLNVGKYVITAVYNSAEYGLKTANGNLFILDGVINQDNYIYYFNQANDGEFFDYVPEGVTLDFQGSIINPNQSIIVKMNVNKPVNIVSTTGDAYVYLNTTEGTVSGEIPNNSFAITYGGSGTNVTGINFHNTQLWVSNAYNVTLDKISNVFENQNVGHLGATSIRNNSSYVTLRNSYFYTKDNGKTYTFTLSWTDHCTIDNCTFEAVGNVGTIIYLSNTILYGSPSGVPLNNYNTLSGNKINGREASSVNGLQIEGCYNLIVNNTLYKSSIGTISSSKNPSNNEYVGNILDEGSITAQPKSVIYDNEMLDLTLGDNSVAHDNIIGGKLILRSGSEVYKNTVDGAVTSTSGEGAYVHDNTLNGGITISKTKIVIENNTIYNKVSIVKAATGSTLINNTIYCTVSVASNNNIIKENKIVSDENYAIDLKTTTGNTVTSNRLLSALYEGDVAVAYSGSNVVKDNYRMLPMISVNAENITVGSMAIINVSIKGIATGNVEISINGKKYSKPIDNGSASLNVSDLGVGQYFVSVSYDGDNNVLPGENTTLFTVSQIKSDAIITTSDLIIGNDVNVTVTIEGATGNITLIVDGVSNNLALTDGVVKHTIKSIKSGYHSIIAIYNGDGTHGFVTNSTNFDLDKLPSEIKVNSTVINYGENAEFNIILSPMISTSILVDIDGNKQIYNVENGVAYMNITGLKVGTHPIVVSFAGDDYYQASENTTAAITVNKINTSLEINAEDISFGDSAYIYVDGLPSEATGTITIYVDNLPGIESDYSIVEDLAEGVHNVRVTYSGDNIYNASEAFKTFNVKYVINIENKDIDFAYGDEAIINVTIPENGNGTLSILVDGLQSNISANVTNGSATFTLSNLTMGDHIISMVYQGSPESIKSNATISVVPKAVVPENVTTSDVISVKLPSNATGNLTVTVDGKDTVIPVVNGAASYSLDQLPAGNHEVTASYSGNYGNFTLLDKTMSVAKTTTTASINAPASVTAGKSSVLSVSLPADATGVVLFDVDGNKYYADINKGVASVNVAGLSAGNKKVTYKYLGDDKYADYTGSTTLKVVAPATPKVKEKATVTLKKITVKKSAKKLVLQATVKVNGKAKKGLKVTFKFNGKKIGTAKTNKNGVAKVTIKKSVLKKLKIGKKVTYIATYNKTTAKKTVKVKK